MLNEMLEAVFVKWLEKEEHPTEVTIDYMQLICMLHTSGLYGRRFDTVQEKIIDVLVDAKENAFKAGFQICLDLINGRLK